MEDGSGRGDVGGWVICCMGVTISGGSRMVSHGTIAHEKWNGSHDKESYMEISMIALQSPQNHE